MGHQWGEAWKNSRSNSSEPNGNPFASRRDAAPTTLKIRLG
jgi:hypothetical protein